MSTDIHLRELMSSDLDLFFEFQLDSEANHMAAFVADNPTDRAAFDAHWRRIQEDSSVVVRSIEYDGRVVGSVCSYSEADKEEVTYWLSKAYWGRGIATRARSLFLKQII